MSRMVAGSGGGTYVRPWQPLLQQDRGYKEPFSWNNTGALVVEAVVACTLSGQIQVNLDEQWFLLASVVKEAWSVYVRT